MKNISILCIFLFAFQANLFSQFQNVVVGTQDSPNEPSIMINPKNVNQVVAAANIQSYFYSEDGGLTWQAGYLNSPYGVWGDPCIIADTAGDFYFLHLSNPSSGSWIDRIVCQKSYDAGHTWTPGSYMGLNGPKAQDKEWSVVDPQTNIIYTSWTQFDSYGSSAPYDSSTILFSRSLDNGDTWSDAVRINQVAGDCLDMDNTVEGAVPAVGPNGEVYISWAGPLGIVFTKSTDQGVTWPDTNTFVCTIPGGWDYGVPGIFRANGLPVTCCDLSNGPYRGTIYINWSDQRNGPTDTDVFLVKSTDGGITWSAPFRVNDDPAGKQQFFTWMAIDQSTGFLYIVFYDRRNYSNEMTDVYLAVSRDGGETFDNMKISESPFDPMSAVFFGDYTNISACNGVVRPIWTRLESYNLSIMTAIVDSLYMGTGADKEMSGPMSLEQNYPNPARDYTIFAYKIHRPCKVTLKVNDIFGNEVALLVNDRYLDPGKYIEKFNLSEAGLAPGFYYFSLISQDQVLNRKMLIE
jgi:hypothetical protein